MRRYTEAPFATVNLIFDILESFLLIRFLFVFFNANAANRIVSFFLEGTEPMVRPFAGIFQTTTAAGLTIEWATVMAMAFYALLLALVLRLLAILSVTVEDTSDDHVRRYQG